MLSIEPSKFYKNKQNQRQLSPIKHKKLFLDSQILLNKKFTYFLHKRLFSMMLFLVRNVIGYSLQIISTTTQAGIAR